MKKHINKIFAGILAVLLLTVALDTKLARPEENTAQRDRFVGFHLVYEKMPPGLEELEANSEEYVEDRSHWVEYGSDSINIDGLGSVTFPRMILIGEKKDGHFVFPGLEGKNCFLAIETNEDGHRYISGYTDMADAHTAIGGAAQSLSGAVYFGPPLDDRNWNTENFDYCWTAYRVYQMEDGTVYLDGSGNSYGGVGGFSFSEKTEWTVTENGESETSSFEVSVKIDSIPRLETVTIKQFDENDQLLCTDTITAQQSNDEGLTFPLDADTDYVLVAETDVDGNTSRVIYEEDGYGERGIYFVSWFLDDEGMGYSVPVWLN